MSEQCAIVQWSQSSPYVKDAFHKYVIRQNKSVVNPDQTAQKCGTLRSDLAGGQSATLKLRLTTLNPLQHGQHATALGTISSPAHQERAVEVPGTNYFEAGFDKLF